MFCFAMQRLHKENEALKKERSSTWEMKKAGEEKLVQLQNVLEEEGKQKVWYSLYLMYILLKDIC